MIVELELLIRVLLACSKLREVLWQQNVSVVNDKSFLMENHHQLLRVCGLWIAWSKGEWAWSCLCVVGFIPVWRCSAFGQVSSVFCALVFQTKAFQACPNKHLGLVHAPASDHPYQFLHNEFTCTSWICSVLKRRTARLSYVKPCWAMCQVENHLSIRSVCWIPTTECFIAIWASFKFSSV